MRKLIQRPGWYLFWVFWATFWGILAGRMALDEIALIPTGAGHVIKATAMLAVTVGFAIGLQFNALGMIEATRKR